MHEPLGKSRSRAGFTLIELLIVMAIIGLIVAFVTAAASDSIQTANARATQALIAKLEVGVTDRMDALNRTRADVNAAHHALGGIYVAGSTPPVFLPSDQRSQVIAQYDYIKSEFPDVFMIQNNANYPINFAALPFPGTPVNSSLNDYNYVLPLGNAVMGPYQSGNGFGANNLIKPTGSGIYGASYTAAAGIYKNLGYAPIGYDGNDNDNNGLVDDYTEGIYGLTPDAVNTIQTRLAAHTHKTARSEMLYAVLVEGRGPFGSVFSAQDFTPNEVKDTDGDGLPEFVDAWGEPLQFYRWPVHYPSDIQRGYTPYGNAISPRERDQLDPNNQLVAPAWWSGTTNNQGPTGDPFSLPSSSTMSDRAYAFQQYFHSLIEPEAGPASQFALNPAQLWNRTTGSTPLAQSYAHRRAYLAKFLILSGGGDKEIGVGILGRDYGLGDALVPITPANLTQIENSASPTSPLRADAQAPAYTPGAYQSMNYNSATTYQLQIWRNDDITNQPSAVTSGVKK